MLSFLNPVFLLGLAAATIPLIIHFLSRSRAREQQFSSLLLLKEVQSRNVRRLRTRRLLLLILRTLIIALLVLVLSRPVVRGIFGAGPADHLPVSAVFIMDNSGSTGYVGRSGPVADFMHQRFEQIRGWLNPSDRYRLITASEGYEFTDGGTWLTPGERRPEQQPAPPGPGYGATDLSHALEAAAELLAGVEEGREREIYLFTDSQRGFLGEDSLPSGNDIRCYLVEGHREAPSNLAVEWLGLPGELVRPGAPLKATVRLAARGTSEPVEAFPRLYLDDELAGQGEVLLEPGIPAAVVIELPPTEPGTYELSARIDADALASDNSRSVVLDVPDRLHVTLLASESSLPEYLVSALEVLSGGATPPITFDRRTRLPLTGEAADGTDVFIVHGAAFAPASLNSFLSLLPRTEMSLIFIPSAVQEETSEGTRYLNTVLSRLELPLELTPGAEYGEGNFDLPAAPEGAAASGAVYGRLFSVLPGLERLRLRKLRRLLPPQGGGSAGGAQAAAATAIWDLRTRTGSTLFRLVREKESAVLVSATDLASPAETELPETPLFVPLLHSLITIVNERVPHVERDVRVGEDVDIVFGTTVETGGMEVHGPGGEKYLLPPGEHSRVDFKDTDRPGIYRIYGAGGMMTAFGVNMDPGEFDVRLEKEDVVQEKLAGYGLRTVAGGDELSESVLLSRGGVEIWPALLVLVLLLLIVEQIVANRKEEIRENGSG